MRVSKNSGIAKLYKDLNMVRPTNVCWLFWKTLFIATMCAVFAAAGIMIAATYLVGLVSLFHLGFVSVDGYVLSSQVIFTIATAIGLVGLLFDWADNATRKLRPASDNLVIKYIKAKKARVCPLVEWEE